LDAFYSRPEVEDCLEDVHCGSYFRDGNGMVFVTECVRGTFAPGVMHDDLDALLMLKGRADVPCIQCMKTT
jgi:hypothetical protein